MTLRKSLIAAATALTVSAAGVGVASAAEPATDTNQSSQFILAADANDDKGSSSSSLSSSDDDKKEEGGEVTDGGSSDIDVEDVTGWLGVFTAIIGAASALAGFISKFMA